MWLEVGVIQRLVDINSTAFVTGPDQEHGLIVVATKPLPVPAYPFLGHLIGRREVEDFFLLINPPTLHEVLGCTTRAL